MLRKRSGKETTLFPGMTVRGVNMRNSSVSSSCHLFLDCFLCLFLSHIFAIICRPCLRVSSVSFNRLCLSGIGTADGGAKKDEDFKGKSQRQVQFNPGQTRATWRVRILTDGTYERAETFQILLSEPVMGVMEFPTSATVEILDPSDG